MKPFREGLHELGGGLYAYLQSGAWGLSNAGLIADGEETLLVDTLFDAVSTQRMLSEMRRAVPAAAHIDTVVNTHANGDHCWGNSVVRDSKILASKATSEEMADMTPARLTMLLRAARVAVALGPVATGVARVLDTLSLSAPRHIVEAAPFVLEIFGGFQFEGLELVLPTETFEGEHILHVGDREVRLLEVGPAHSRGDTLVHVPSARTVFTGDILFEGFHPIVWEGSFDNWIAACERIDTMDVDVVVPGHGPVTDKAAVRRMAEYLRLVQGEARRCFDAGCLELDAAHHVMGQLGIFTDLHESERVFTNVRTAYRDFRHEGRDPTDTVQVMAAMAKFRAHQGHSCTPCLAAAHAHGAPKRAAHA